MSKEKITVITASYNLIKSGRETFFRQCLESVNKQTYKNIEHIVIDGASNDGTVELLKEYERKGYIKYISEPDNGIYDAMNKGIDIATGSYIAFLNSDDYWHDNRAVEYALKTFEETDCDFCGGNTRFIDEEKPERNHIRYANLVQIFTMMPFCHQAMFCKTDVMRNEGKYDLQYKSAGDYEFLIRLYFKGYKAAVIPLTFATFRMGGESFTNYELSWNECKKIAHHYYDKFYVLNQKEEDIFIKENLLPSKLVELLEPTLKDKQSKNIPCITIVTVCFNLIKANRIESFKKCLESVHSQSYTNIEHLIIDGSSNDGTIDVIQEYAAKGWVSYISEPDKGIYDAMSKGAKRAVGDYVYFLNTDDYLHDKNVVEDVLGVFSSANVDVVFGNIVPYLLDENAPYVKVFDLNVPAKWNDIITANDILLKRNIHHQTIFYKKSILEKASFFSDEIPDGSDWLLHCQIFLRDKCSFKYYDREITNFNMGGVSTNKKNSPIEECQKLQQALYKTYKPYLKSDVLSETVEISNVVSTAGEVSTRLEVKTKKIKFLDITILRKKYSLEKKKIYLFNFIPVLKVKYEVFRKKYYLFSFLPIAYKYKKNQIREAVKVADLLKLENTNLSNTIVALSNEINSLKHSNRESFENDEKFTGNIIALKNQYKKTLETKEKLEAEDYRKSYSHCGEDAVIDFILFYFTNVNKSELKYLDIGANYPIASNNTYRFYKMGARGILVEPNKELADLCAKERPGDTVINAGVKFSNLEEATYYSLSENGLNTFSKDSADYAISMGHQLLASYELPLMSINSIIDEYFDDKKLDILSIDAEGVTFEILQTLDFSKIRPTIICIESEKESYEYGYPHKIIDYMQKKNYMLMADTSINFIFLDKNKYVKGKYC